MCECDCGVNKLVRMSSLRNGTSTNCGCVHKFLKDVVGERHGQLTVIECLGTDDKGNRLVNCSCDCGGSKKTRLDYVRRGKVKSCGCLVSEANLEIGLWLEKEGYLFEPEYTDDRCKNKRHLPFDFAVWADDLRLIEFQGWHHFHEMPKRGGVSRLKDAQLHDKIKRNFCEDNNIPLLAIHYSQRDDMFNLIKSFLS